MPLQPLVGNLAVVALFLVIWIQFQGALIRLDRRIYAAVFGLVMAAGAVTTMVMAVPLGEGVLIDLRSTLLVSAGFFGGPLAASITVVCALAYRFAIGGVGASAGMLVILSMTALGLVGFWLTRHSAIRIKHVLLMALAEATITIACFLILPREVGLPVLQVAGLPLFVLCVVSNFATSCAILHSRWQLWERQMLHAALMQSPDFQYVKDTQGRFVAVNRHVAAFHGFERPEQMLGLSDADLDQVADDFTLPAEAEIIRTGVPQTDLEEAVRTKDGQLRWFSTSKVPLRDWHGTIIGLAGVTRDVSEHKQLETALRENRDRLEFALTEMSDGLAMFDTDGCLLFCNERYRKLFALTEDLRRPGVSLQAILEGADRRGEQKDLGPAGIAKALEQLRAGGDQQVELFNGKWLHVRTRPTREGKALVMVSDITQLKDAELSLMHLTDQLRALSDTDALTGLHNRRAFDRLVGERFAQGRRDGKPVSLLMIDVDRFKAFNDAYGHPAGDACLRQVAGALTQTVCRGNDVVARYGGEEFAVVLYDADEDQAFAVAQNIRRAVRDLAVPHQGSDKGVVTVSVGIGAGSDDLQPTQLVQAADEALYIAKAAGRDRVMGATFAPQAVRH